MKCSMKFITFIVLFLILTLWSIPSNAVVLNVDKVENQPLPTETTIIILDDKQNEIAREETDDKGVLVVDLPDGNYTMQTEDGKKIGLIGFFGGILTVKGFSIPGTPPKSSGAPKKVTAKPSPKPPEGTGKPPAKSSGTPDKVSGKSAPKTPDGSGKSPVKSSGVPDKVTGKSIPKTPKDYVSLGNQPEIKKLTAPIIEDMPSGGGIGGKIGRGLFGVAAGMGGLSAGGSGFEEEGPELEDKPKGDWTRLEGGPKGKTKIDLIAQPNEDGTGLNVGMKVKKAPGKGTPHLLLLQHVDGMIIQPYQVLIFELWGEFTLSVSVWRETYQDGQLVSREHMGTTTSSWKELLGSYTAVIEGPAIWQRLGSSPFKKIRGVIAQFKLPAGFDPSKWSIIAHVTGKGKNPSTGKKVIKTVPFVADLSGNFQEGKLEVIKALKTRFQRAHGS